MIKYLTITLLFFLNIITAQNLTKIDSVLKLGNYKLALQQLKSKDQTFNVLDKTADVYVKVGKYKQAIVNYKEALKLKQNVFVKEKLGKSYQGIGNYKMAILIFEELLKNNQNNNLLKYHLAKLFYKTKKREKAKGLYISLIKKDSNNVNYHYKLAKVYLDLKDSGNAISYFKTTLKLDSLHDRSAYRLAKIYRIKKGLDSTNIYLKKGLKINPKSVILNQLNIKVAFKSKDFKSVIIGVQKLDSLKANTTFYKKLLGISFYHDKQYKKAENTLKEIAFTKETDEKIMYYLGLTYKGLKDYTQANLFITLSISMQRPKLNTEYYQLALIKEIQQKPKETINYLKLSLKEKTNNPKALYKLATLSENYFKDKKIALAHYKQYINFYGGNDKNRTAYANQQIKKINTLLFHKKE